MCIYSKRLVVTCASLLLGVVPDSFAQSAQTRPPEPATTASAPVLSELPFRLDGYGRTDSGTDTLLLPQMQTTVLVKVPLSDYLIDPIDPATQTDSLTAILSALESFGQGLQAGFDGSAFFAQANQLQKGGLCLYDNPTLPVAHSGISWLATEGEYLSDGTALVSLPVDIQSDKLVVGQRSPQVALTRVRCVPSKMMDVSGVLEAAQELQKSLEAETGASAQMRIVDDFKRIVLQNQAVLVNRILSNDATVATNVTSDESDAFTAKRVLTLEVVPPDYSTEWGALWKTFCVVRIGDRDFDFLTESQNENRVFPVEISNANTNSLESICVVYERSAWSPSDQSPVQEAQENRARALSDLRERLLSGQFVLSGRFVDTTSGEVVSMSADAGIVFTPSRLLGQDDLGRSNFLGTMTISGVEIAGRRSFTVTCGAAVTLNFLSEEASARGPMAQVDIIGCNLMNLTISVRAVFSVDGGTTERGSGRLSWYQASSAGEDMIFELGALPPTSVESSTSDRTAPSSATTAANVSDKGCSFVDSTFYCEGFDEVAYATEYLDERTSRTYALDLQIGDHIFIGRCDSDCNDIDLGVQDANGTLVGEDLDPDDAPTVRLSVTTPGEYQVTVSMYACSAEPCEFTLATLKESDVER